MNLSIEVQGIEQAQRRVAQLPKQARYAGARALNDAAFKAGDDFREQIRKAFDRPTPYIERSPFVVKQAEPGSLSAWVAPKYPGGKGVEPASVLLAEVAGGVRRAKRFELALRRAGVLPQNMAAVPATWLLADPQAGDGYGGIKGSFIVRLLSVLQAFGEQGYRANATAKSIAKLSGRGRWINGRFVGAHTKKGATKAGAKAVRQGGVEYFVSKGKGTLRVSRANAARGKFADGQGQHLPAGIWQRKGVHGEDVKPVFLFTRMPRYTARLDLPALAQRAMTVHFPPAFNAQLQRALENAR